MAEMFVGRVTPPIILWACLHLALSHVLRYHCQIRATTGLLGEWFYLKVRYIDAFYRHCQPEEPHALVKLLAFRDRSWTRQVTPECFTDPLSLPTASPSQPLLARHATPFPFPWEEHYVMREKMTALRDYYRHWRRQRASLPLFHKNPQYESYGHF